MAIAHVIFGSMEATNAAKTKVRRLITRLLFYCGREGWLGRKTAMCYQHNLAVAMHCSKEVQTLYGRNERTGSLVDPQTWI